MAEARLGLAWAQTAEILSMLWNRPMLAPDELKRPSDFNPMAERRPEGDDVIQVPLAMLAKAVAGQR